MDWFKAISERMKRAGYQVSWSAARWRSLGYCPILPFDSSLALSNYRRRVAGTVERLCTLSAPTVARMLTSCGPRVSSYYSASAFAKL